MFVDSSSFTKRSPTAISTAKSEPWSATVSTSIVDALRSAVGTVVTVIMLPARSTGALPFNTIVSTDRVSAFSLASTV